MSYAEFLDGKRQMGGDHGFDPTWMPDALFDFQRSLVEWSTRRGRAAVLADTGLGKSVVELVWAENVAKKTGKKVLILAPLAVSSQMVREGQKFGIEVEKLGGGIPKGRIGVSNYEKLHLFDSSDYAGVVGDESSCLKAYGGVRRKEITDFLRKVEYRLLCTATAAPNDHIELGTHSEALGELGYIDMLGRFFVNDQRTVRPMRSRARSHSESDEHGKWRFKKHAKQPFWRWVCSWARALRRPSDIGFDDSRFILPPLVENLHFVKARAKRAGFIFDLPSVGLREQREERRRTIRERCEKVAELVIANAPRKSLVWCQLNPEGDLLEKLIPGAVQVAGKDGDEKKEESLLAFAEGDLRVLVSKPKIAGFGLNLQRCSHVTFFPSHSFEMHYQGIRRCWRFGQDHSVVVDVVSTEGEKEVMDNLQRKQKQADEMFGALVRHVQEAVGIVRTEMSENKIVPPSFLRTVREENGR